MALSHSLGPSPQLTTTTKTLHEFKKGVEVSSLPKTFQGAVQITRKSGPRFLWIDPLCIIQDDPQDWERESAQMACIYTYGYLTISASASPDGRSGCFPGGQRDTYITPSTRSLGYQTPRDATGWQSMIDYKYSTRPGRRSRVHLFDELLSSSKSYSPQSIKIGVFGKYFDPIPRNIHYTSDQLYYECESMQQSEDGFEFPVSHFCLKYCLSTQRIPFEMHGISKHSGISFIAAKPAERKGPR